MPQLKILLAEDNKINQLIAQKVLAKHDHQVITVNNGHEAVEAVQQDDFDAILMDIQMPRMGGLEAAHKIKELGKNYEDIPIFALTAFSDKEHAEAIEEAGMLDYLTKPFHPKDLDRMLIQYVVRPDDPSYQFNRNKTVDLGTGYLATLMDEFGPEYARSFVESSMEETRRLAKAIERGAKEKDGKKIVGAAHDLKSICGNLDLQESQRIAIKVDKLGEGMKFNRALSKDIRELASTLEMELEILAAKTEGL